MAGQRRTRRRAEPNSAAGELLTAIAPARALPSDGPGLAEPLAICNRFSALNMQTMHHLGLVGGQPNHQNRPEGPQTLL